MRNINVVELNRIVNELKKIEKSRLSKIYLPELKLLNLRFNDSEKTSLIIMISLYLPLISLAITILTHDN